jgi:isopenicillin-N N-acyltransferase like protein
MDGTEGLKVIECSGTAYEIGFQYGEASKDNIRRGLDILASSLEKSPLKLRVDRNMIVESAKKYLPNARAFDPDGIERVRGTADGAGISFDEAFAINCYIELFINYPGLAGMCTSFAVAGPATRNGITILGQNIDWRPDATLDLIHIRHADGLEQLSITFFGSPCYNLNSAGIGNSTNLTVCPMGPVTGHVPASFYLYAAMRKHTLQEAFDILKRGARGIGYYHLADADGAMAGLESVYDGYTVLEPDRGILVHANHYETRRYAEHDMAPGFMPDSFQRAPRLRKLIHEHYGSLTPKIMMTLLADHDGYPNSICRHLDTSMPDEAACISAASVIMVPGDRKMYLSAGQPCTNKYLEFSL